jgi:YhcH/YjgK/YiaL family protein
MISPDLKNVKKWFDQRDWAQGWGISPHVTIDIETFFSAYGKTPGLWDQAFKFLETTDLQKLKNGVYPLDGTDLVAKLEEYTTRNESETKYEAHRKYADIQYVITGTERIAITALDNCFETVPYDDSNDIVFLDSRRNDYHLASPRSFFIFFPSDAHRPCVKNMTTNVVKKVVLKIRIG